ncbi:MAG: TonB-dependent receptor [Crocinitomicaceae bacterium]|nr:TonB-dependent receptor [Crocinitomicaceae bacterium]
MSLIFRLLLFSFLSVNAFSQECTNSYIGIILDDHDLSPVTSAKIVFKDLNKTFSTNNNGTFKIDNLCEGNYNALFYHHIGCEPVKKTIKIPFNGVDTIYLEHHYSDEIAELNEITIVGTHRHNTNLQSIESVSPLELKINTGSNFGDIIKTIAGVSTLTSGASIQKPVIRGMYGNRVLTIVDNVRLEGQQWGNEHAPEINPYTFDKIEIIKGADALSYGADAIGGVILTNMSYIPHNKTLNGMANLGYATNGNQLFGNLKLTGRSSNNKWAWLTQGAYKKGGTLSSPTYNLSNTAMNEINTGFALFYEGEKYKSHINYAYYHTSNGILSAAHVEDIDEFYEAIENKQPSIVEKFTYKINEPQLQTRHHLITWNNDIPLKKPTDFINFNYSFQLNQRKEIHHHEHEEEEHEEESQHESEGIEMNLITNQFTIKYHHSWHKQLEGNIGVNYIYQSNQTKEEYFIPNYLKNATGIYWIETWQPIRDNSKHFLSSGIRFDYSRLDVSGIQNETFNRYQNNYSNLVGTIAYNYRPNHHFELITTIGNTYRTPTINELFSNGAHDAIYSKGNSTITSEKAIYANIHSRYSSVRWNLTIDIYSYYFWNYIAFQAMNTPIITDHGALPSFEYTQTKANYSGIDLFFDYKFTKWLTFQLKGSLVRAFDLNSYQHLSYIPADRLQPALKFSTELKNKDQFTAIIGSTLVNKQYKAPIEYGFVEAPKGYALLDLSIVYSLNYNKGIIDFIVKIDNLLNTQYRDYMNRYRYFANELGRTVSFKLGISF